MAAGEPRLGVATVARENCTSSPDLNQQYAKLSVYPDGQLIHVKMPPRQGLKREHVPNKRGRVDGFSRQARGRMIRKLGTLKRSQPLPFWVTLTVDDSVIDQATPRQLKAWLRSLLKRMSRRAKCGAFWRLEVQRRKSGAHVGTKVAHLHLLLFGGKDIVGEIPVWWHEITGSTDGAHLLHGTKCERMKDWGHVLSYVSKYAAKIEAPGEGAHGGEGAPERSEGGALDPWEGLPGRSEAEPLGYGTYLSAEDRTTGRIWGVWGREAIDFAQLEETFVAAGAGWDLIRAIRRICNGRSTARWRLSSAPGTWSAYAHCLNMQRLRV